MASAGEEENANQELSETRRTRSGRVVNSMPSTPRAKRGRKLASQGRAYKKEATGSCSDILEEPVAEEQTTIEKTSIMLNTNNGEEQVETIEQVETVEQIETVEQVEFVEQVVEDDKFVEQVVEADTIEQSDDVVVMYNETNNYEEYQEQTEIEEDVEMYDEEQNNTEVPLAAEAGIDDKSSSFPFGTAVGQSESSEEAQNEEDTSGEKCAVDGSLLASLAGDNANSLPSVGGGDADMDSNKKEDFSTTEVIGSESAGNHVKLDTDTDSLSEPAIAESIAGATDASDGTIVNTELVSEDELPLPTKPEINDAEEVSDDELPAPKRAELPPDAEVISEDELPPNADKKSPTHKSTKKRKTAADKSDDNTSDTHKKLDGEKKATASDEQYNPMSPTSESDDSAEPSPKKVKTENDTEKKENRRENEKDKEKIERKRLPDLDKYWRPVKEDPTDFTGWTYLLQYVDNESDAEAAREAYDAFLAQYPYCYGYWRKYADYEKRKGIKTNCNVVFERGLEAIPLSVDLWIHYLTHVKNTQPDDEEYIRAQFDRAINACGLEFRSDKLWDAYIKWESDGKRFSKVFQIYDRLLAIPTQSYSGHFDNFQDLLNRHALTSLLPEEELRKFRTEVHEAKLLSKNRRSASKEAEDAAVKDIESTKKSDETENNNETPNAEASNAEQNCTEMQDLKDLSTLTEEETSAIRSRVIATRRKVHKATVAAVTARWTFEEGIKRPYFHVKPLERCQLKNWKDYLDFEIERGDRQRILVLFERCLIACALYDEFWLKMIRYLETENDEPDNVELIRNVFRRACEIHHPDKPSLHLMWAAFEECENNFDAAAAILTKLETKVPNLLQIAYRRINVERRRGDLQKCREFYEHYIEHAKNKTIAGSLAIKYARFLNKICNNLEEGLAVLRKILEKDPANTRVALQMIDLALQRPDVHEEEIVDIMDRFMARDGIEAEQKVLFAQRKVEFLEDFGKTAKGLQDAQRGLQLALSKANEAKKKRESSPSRKTAQASGGGSGTNAQTGSGYNSAGTTTGANATSYNYNTSANSSYYGQSNNSGNYQQQQQQQSYDNYYNHWQYGSGGYSGYGQWSGYGNYY